MLHFLIVWFILQYASISITHRHTYTHAHSGSPSLQNIWQGNSASFDATRSICETKPFLYSQNKSEKFKVVQLLWQYDIKRHLSPECCLQGLDSDSSGLCFFFLENIYLRLSCFLCSAPRDKQTVGKECFTVRSSHRGWLLALYFRRKLWRKLLLPHWGLAEPSETNTSPKMGQVVNSRECWIPPTFFWI
jgi:hypothetical protein